MEKIPKEWMLRGLYLLLFFSAGLLYVYSNEKTEQKESVLQKNRGIQVEGIGEIQEQDTGRAENADREYEKTAVQEESSASAEENVSPKTIFVHVCGEVVNPGLYELAESARVYDAVLAAGGMTEDGNDAACNFAAELQDGQQIRIPSQSESVSDAWIIQDSSGVESFGEKKVNLNTANQELLMTLPGIGEAKARDIINYREQHGGFKTPEEIMQISGIKQAAYEKIKDKIVVEP